MIEWIVVGIFGLCVGSFLNVAILRIPEGKSVLFPASHCAICDHSLSWYHNIPLFSWLALRGKCAFCKAPISVQYPLIELLTSLLYLLVFFHTEHLIQSFILGTVFALLLALSLVDLRYKAVPDLLSLPALVISFFTLHPLESFQNGLLFMGGFAFLRMGLSSLLQKEVMGEADIIIAGIIGALVGVKLGLFAIYISAVISLVAFMVVRKRGYELPYIPFLSIGLLITWLFDTPILAFLEKLYE